MRPERVEVSGTTEPDYPCPCCGHLVFGESPGSYEICPVCFWEDDLVQLRWPDFVGGPNTLSLVECQRNYQTFGAVKARVLEYVRAPAENEPVDAGWYPLGRAALDCFEPNDDYSRPWPEDRTRLYWWRTSFWRAQPPSWTGWAGAANVTDPENWYGGFYELAIELSDTGDAYLERMLANLWRTAGIEGCYRRRAGARDAFDYAFDDAQCTAEALDQHGHLHGTVLLPGGQRVACGALAIRGGGGSDWLDFYIPMEALGRADRSFGAFASSGDRYVLAWRRQIDDWLADLARELFRAQPFQLALIGHEVSGDTEAADLEGEVPEQRFIGYLLPRASGLDYAAANC